MGHSSYEFFFFCVCVCVCVCVSDASMVALFFHEVGSLFHVVPSADCSRMPAN